MPKNFSRDFRSLHQRLPDHEARITLYKANLIQFDQGAHFPGKALDLESRARFYPILFPTCFDNRVHYRSVLEQSSVI